MIVRRTHNDPASRTGYEIFGSTTSDLSGNITITIKGKDYSQKVTGICLTPLDASASQVVVAKVTSITYNALTRITTIAGKVFVSDDLDTPVFSGANSCTVFYSMWVDERALPTNQSTNNTLKQEY